LPEVVTTSLDWRPAGKHLMKILIPFFLVSITLQSQDDLSSVKWKTRGRNN